MMSYDSVDSWDVNTEIIRKRLEDGGATPEMVLTLCAALEDLRTWNTSLSGRLIGEIEKVNTELVVQRRANANLLHRLGTAESEKAVAEARAHALAELTADVIVQRDEAQAVAESPL